jgi:hypothetical protein
MRTGYLSVPDTHGRRMRMQALQCLQVLQVLSTAASTRSRRLCLRQAATHTFFFIDFFF